MTTRTLHIQVLIDKRAYQDQIDLFRKRFGESVEVSPELCASVASLFSWDWAAEKLLSDAARADYKRIRDAARADYTRIEAQAWADYMRIAATARADYKRIRDAARADYERIEAQARADYERIVATAFATAYIKDKST